MEQDTISFYTCNQPVAINNHESATKVANLLIDKLQEFQGHVSMGKTNYDLLKQLKDIVFCIYYSAEKEYTSLLHEVVSYVLFQIFKHEN